MQVISTININYTIIAMEAVRRFRASINSNELIHTYIHTYIHTARTYVYVYYILSLSNLIYV